MENLTADFNKLIEDSLSKLAMDNDWKMGGMTQCPLLLFKNGMQISFDNHEVCIWTKPAGERGEFFKIRFDEMRKDKRLNAFVHVMIKSYCPSND